MGSKTVGYGMFKGKRATHIALFSVGKPRNGKLMALHSCDNPPCVNPSHLRWGTCTENMQDMWSRNRHRGFAATQAAKTHCAHGHEMTPENTYIRIRNGRPRRHCRACQNALMNKIRRADRKRWPDYKKRQRERIKAMRDQSLSGGAGHE